MFRWPLLATPETLFVAVLLGAIIAGGIALWRATGSGRLSATGRQSGSASRDSGGPRRRASPDPGHSNGGGGTPSPGGGRGPPSPDGANAGGGADPGSKAGGSDDADDAEPSTPEDGTVVYDHPTTDDAPDCPGCGTTVDPAGRFCGECGALWDRSIVLLQFDESTLEVSYDEPYGTRIRNELRGDELGALAANQISQEHIEFTRHDGTTHVRDLGSKNGTRVNGTELSPDEWQEVTDGDTITIADAITATVRVPP